MHPQHGACPPSTVSFSIFAPYKTFPPSRIFSAVVESSPARSSSPLSFTNTLLILHARVQRQIAGISTRKSMGDGSRDVKEVRPATYIHFDRIPPAFSREYGDGDRVKDLTYSNFVPDIHNAPQDALPYRALFRQCLPRTPQLVHLRQFYRPQQERKVLLLAIDPKCWVRIDMSRRENESRMTRLERRREETTGYAETHVLVLCLHDIGPIP